MIQFKSKKEFYNTYLAFRSFLDQYGYLEYEIKYEWFKLAQLVKRDHT